MIYYKFSRLNIFCIFLKLPSHGRDGKLKGYQFREEDEQAMDKDLPELGKSHHRPPWLKFVADVFGLGYCTFSALDQGNELLVALPDANENENVVVWSFPSGKQRSKQIRPPSSHKSGMVMSVALFKFHGQLWLVIGYESGGIALFIEHKDMDSEWIETGIQVDHTQPVLSLAVSPNTDFVLSSSADSRIIKYYFEFLDSKVEIKRQESKTRHNGQAAIAVRNDGIICGTAGWDGRIRVYSVQTLAELAVLKWHKTGCLCIAFGLKIREKGKNWIVGGSKDGKVSLWEVY